MVNSYNNLVTFYYWEFKNLDFNERLFFALHQQTLDLAPIIHFSPKFLAFKVVFSTNTRQLKNLLSTWKRLEGFPQLLSLSDFKYQGNSRNFGVASVNSLAQTFT